MAIKANQLWIVLVSGQLCDLVRRDVQCWDWFSKKTIGTQLVRSADSIVANIVEGYGRSHALDALRFYSIARGSLEETLTWLKRANAANLLEKQKYVQWTSRYQLLSRSLNKFIQVHTPH